VQDLNASTICRQSQDLGAAYQSLSQAYVNLAQIHGAWNKEVNEYLHEEKYLNASALEFVDSIVELLEAITPEMQRLAQDHESLCNDLVRVGRGQSFSV